MQAPPLDVKETAGAIIRMFPTLDPEEQRLSIELYRLLADGQSVPVPRLAERLRRDPDEVSRVLQGWPGVFLDQQGEVMGYWGLSPTFETPHRFKLDGRTLYAWCAWDTLFLPRLLGKTAEVDSTCPTTRTPVRLTVAPDGIRHAEPREIVMSFLLPDREKVKENVVTSFCNFLHFFASKQAGESYGAEHPGMLLLSLEEAFELGRHKNEMQYRHALR